MPSRLIVAVDGCQRRRSWLGFPIAVVYKFTDDQGPYLTALITYYGFLSLFPLLLLLTTILGFALDGNPQLQSRLVDSTIAEFPIVGTQLRDNVHSLNGSGLGLTIGIIVTIYGCLGVEGSLVEVPLQRELSIVVSSGRGAQVVGDASFLGDAVHAGGDLLDGVVVA